MGNIFSTPQTWGGQLRVAIPTYSTHPDYSRTVDALTDDPIPIIQNHEPSDIQYLNPVPVQANFFCFGFDDENSTVCDAYATSVYPRAALEEQAKIIRKAKTIVAATLLDSDKNPIIGVDPDKYAASVKKLLVDGYGIGALGGDFEWRCSHYGPTLTEIFEGVQKRAPATTFYATCYKGEADLPALAMLKEKFSNVSVNTMGYELPPKYMKVLIETYIKKGKFKPSNIFLGVSVHSTPHENLVPLTQLAKEMGLGGMYVWKVNGDVEKPKPGHAPNMKLFPVTQTVQEAMDPTAKTRPRISHSEEAPARLGIWGKVDVVARGLYKRAFAR